MSGIEGYSATRGLMNFLLASNNGPALGTGVSLLVVQADNLLGSIPQIFLDFNLSYQNNLFGDYPTPTDKVPSAIFAVAFFVLGILHATVFAVNASRQHYFWLSLGWIFYCVMRFIGWMVRIFYADVPYKISMGIADEVFLILPSIFLNSFNLLLAQRIFTWRHPVGGSRRLFWNLMIGFYCFVGVIVVVTILASAVPYFYFLSESAYKNWQKIVQFSAVLIVAYNLTAISLIALSYFFKPTKKDENLYTYQPWWIESFSPFYFVKPGAKVQAEETFMKRNHNHRHAIRVIAATHHHYNMVEGLTNQRGGLTHNLSLGIMAFTTVLLLTGAVLRCIVVFQGRYRYNCGPLCKPVAMYICWGLFEFITNILYLVARFDLRFYRPDKLPKKVRSIITAEQSGYVSGGEITEEEEEEEEEEIEEEDEEFKYDTDENSSPHYNGSSDDEKNLQFYPPNYNYQPKLRPEKSVDEFHF